MLPVIACSAGREKQVRRDAMLLQDRQGMAVHRLHAVIEGDGHAPGCLWPQQRIEIQDGNVCVCKRLN